MKNDSPLIDLEAGVRSFLRNTIFAHPEDIKEDEKKKGSMVEKLSPPKKKKGQ